MLFKLSNLNSNLSLTVGYLNPALNNSAQAINFIARGIILRIGLILILGTELGDVHMALNVNRLSFTPFQSI